MIDPARTVVLKRTLTQEDFDRFAELSGDDNPIHVDAEFSAATRFGKTVAHGLLLNTVLRGMVEQLVPGGRQLSQNLKFPAPTYANEALCFSVQLDAHKGGAAEVSMLCRRIEDDVVTCRGSTTVRTAGGEDNA